MINIKRNIIISMQNGFFFVKFARLGTAVKFVRDVYFLCIFFKSKKAILFC